LIQDRPASDDLSGRSPSLEVVTSYLLNVCEL
jgi:hypothetical protein